MLLLPNTLFSSVDRRDLLEAVAHTNPNETLITTDEHFISRNNVIDKQFHAPKLFKTDYFRTPGWFHNTESNDEVRLIRPKNRALCIGGHGAISDLHVDPYNWTGWNALMYGSKIWRFISPDATAENMYSWRRPNAHNLTAGYNSMGNLYHRHNEKENCYHAAKRYRNLNKQIIYEVTQVAGEIITIPSGWWHQTFHKGVTVGLASQYINENNVDHVIQSLIDWHAIGDGCLGEDYSSLSQMLRSRRVMECIVKQGDASDNYWYTSRMSSHCERPFSVQDADGLYRCKRKSHQQTDL